MHRTLNCAILQSEGTNFPMNCFLIHDYHFPVKNQETEFVHSGETNIWITAPIYIDNTVCLLEYFHTKLVSSWEEPISRTLRQVKVLTRILLNFVLLSVKRQSIKSRKRQLC